jgi:GNAT superfamily N-acetyltransferase
MHDEWTRDNLLVSTDPAKLNVAAVHAFLSRAYWCVGIPRDTVERALRHSLCFGLYDGHQQVGLARVITDHATFAYLCDVYVLESHRGRGLGQWLIECVMAHPSVPGLRRFNLATRDAHSLYARHGFQPLHHPENHLELHKPDIYKTPVSGGEFPSRSPRTIDH